MRIAAGDNKGRRLRVPRGVRPTGAKVREALFSIWHHRVEGARFLDLFAGSGSVGLEALSRGAREAVFVERRGKVLPILRENCRELGLGRSRVVVADLPDELERRRSGPLFDLVFADPPYGYETWERLVRGVEAILAPSGQLAIEHSARSALPTKVGNLGAMPRRTYGETSLTVYVMAGVQGASRRERS